MSTLPGCRLMCRLGQYAYHGRLQSPGISRSYSSQLAEIREQLKQYQAGTVDLHKNSDTGIAVLTLNNPQRKNALSGSMMVELADCVTELSQWEQGKGLVLQGAEGTFCSGGDLTTVSNILTSRDGERMCVFMHDTLTRLRALPLVTLALLQGVAVGGGAEMFTATDVRVMTEGARVGFVQVRMGVTTGWGGASRLFRIVGRSKTLSLLGSGRLMTAPEALALGFIDHILPEDASPLDAAQNLLQEGYCRGDLSIIRSVKEMVVGIENSSSMTEALDCERRVFASVWGGEAQKEALNKSIKHA